VKTSPSSQSSPLDLACARLKAAGLRITQPRIAILDALIKRSLPASIEQIHGDLAGSACDLVTVYRCLATSITAPVSTRSASATRWFTMW
jgi:Fur family ferric uptake transcriptional regulator